jgi:nucleoid-associated protein YgaU
MLFVGSRYTGVEVVLGPSSIDAQPEMLARGAIPATPGLVEYVVREGDRLDSIAALFFGDPKKYWLILDANPDELDPLALLTVGRRIQIPANRIVKP